MHNGLKLDRLQSGMHIAEKFSRKNSLAWTEFKISTNLRLQSQPNLVRFDCLNPVKAIKTNFEFNYNIGEDIIILWQNFLNLKFINFNLNLGVRHSLWMIFNKIKSIHLPRGKYPVYKQIAQEAGINYTEYDELSFCGNNLLITFPAFGKDIEQEDYDSLSNWLSQSKQNLLIIDRVYDYNRNNIYIQKLIDTNQVIVCYSLTKLFVSPLLMGLTVLPSHWELDKTDLEEDKVKILLTKYKNFPLEQQKKFDYRWKKLGFHPSLGYLKTIKLEDISAICVPGYLFDNKEWIISCLHETNSFNEDDRQDYYYVTVLSNFAKGYDKYSRKYSKENIPQSTYKDKFFITKNLKIGIDKAEHLAKDHDPLIIIQTSIKNYEVNIAHKGYYVDRNFIYVDKVLDLSLNPILTEEVYSRSISINKLFSWNEVVPRSMSILPISQSCQAKCSFCFSHSSISEDTKQKNYLESFEPLCINSKKLGAERLVITGGGEPTMLSHDKLIKIMQIGKKYFNNIVMITNGYNLSQSHESLNLLKDYETNGLTTLAVSRHSINNNESIMKLNIDIDKIAQLFKNDLSLKLRLICVLQKQGVCDEKSLVEYLNWSAANDVKEICFKELYVAAMNESVYYDSQYNKWCEEHQISMNFLINFLDITAKKINVLPWGSPVYLLNWNGKLIKIAAYTEPSVFWERKNGICRSWNLMADGKCYANLEDKSSLIEK